MNENVSLIRFTLDEVRELLNQGTYVTLKNEDDSLSMFVDLKKEKQGLIMLTFYDRNYLVDTENLGMVRRLKKLMAKRVTDRIRDLQVYTNIIETLAQYEEPNMLPMSRNEGISDKGVSKYIQQIETTNNFCTKLAVNLERNKPMPFTKEQISAFREEIVGALKESTIKL